MIPTLRRNAMVWQPWNDWFALRRQVDQLLDPASPAANGESNLVWAPAVNVREDAENIYVELELPGIDPNAVDIAIEDHVLTVAGEKRHAETRDEQSFHVMERRYGRFERSFTLGRAIDADHIEATYDRGVLTIRLPKPEEARPRRIPIRAVAENRQLSTTAS